MIEPFRQGPELIEEIHATHPFHGSLAIWWLGQSGVLIKTDGGILVIDPSLSDPSTSPGNTRAPLAPTSA